MPGMTLNELLRYGLSGALSIFILIIGFEDALGQYSTEKGEFPLGFLKLGFPFAIGAIGYAIHRAILYLPLYFIAARLAGRRESLNDLDVLRWKNKTKSGSLQPCLNEWAS